MSGWSWHESNARRGPDLAMAESCPAGRGIQAKVRRGRDLRMAESCLAGRGIKSMLGLVLILQQMSESRRAGFGIKQYAFRVINIDIRNIDQSKVL